MIIGTIANPEWIHKETDYKIDSGRSLLDLHPEDIQTQRKFIGVINSRKEQIGAVRTSRLRYVLEKGRDMPFSQILDRLPIGVIAIDRESRIFYVNPAYSKILNVPLPKIIGGYMKTIEKGAVLLNVLKTEKEETREKHLIKSVNRYVSLHVFPLYNHGEFTGACSVFTDITELNYLTNEVKRISQTAEDYRKQIEIGRYLKSRHIIGGSEVYQNCIRKAMLAAKTDASVLIRGENGTGKEIISRVIQENSLRKGRPFIKVNCAAIPEALIESEFFGYEEGAFTGAKKGGRMGKFEMADGGTIFLDEVGDIPLAMQAKLLRVLQEGEIEKVGGHKTIPVNVRVISATNQPLEEMIADKKFRMDLYYRLNVVAVNIPPLRERGNDVMLLADGFLKEFNEKYGQSKTISHEAYIALLKYNWPGNVRELRNIIESAVVLSMGDRILPEDFAGIFVKIDGPPEKGRPGEMPENGRTEGKRSLYEEGVSLRDRMAACEKQIICEALEKFYGNRSLAARALQIPERTFYRKLSEYQIHMRK